MRLKFTISLFLITVLLPDVLGKPPLPVASEFWENSKVKSGFSCKSESV